MDRRRFLAALAAAGLPSIAIGQRKTPVIGLLWNDSIKPSPFAASLLSALAEKGYTPGRHIRIEDRVSLEGYGGYAESAAELVRGKVDLIVTYGGTATITAAQATKEIPIVMVMGLDPVARGLAASLSRPGGNVTGVITLSTDLTEKRFDLLKQLAPGVTRVGVLTAPNVGHPAFVRESEVIARNLKLQLQYAQASGAADVESRVTEMVQAGAGAIYVTGSTLLAAHSQIVVTAVGKQRVPVIYSVERYADAGGLMVYAPNIRRAFGRAANYVDRILKGAAPGELAIEQVSDVELIVNLKTARALGITVPHAILLRANRLIE